MLFEGLILSSSTRIRGIQHLRRACHCVYYHPSPTTQLFRMMSSHMFDNTGGQYNVTRILTPQSTLDEAAYKEYSPLFLSYVVVTLSFVIDLSGCSASFAMAYGLSFATITATLVHSALYFRKQIWLQVGRSLSEQPDVHARLMARYPQGSLAYNCTPCLRLTVSSSGVVVSQHPW